MIPKFTNLKEALSIIKDNDVVVTSGFVGCSNPEALEAGVEKRFKETNSPKNLTLFYVAGQGDGDDKSVNHLAHEGLLGTVIAGHFNKAPKLMDLMAANKIKGYNVPQGALAQMLRNVAGKKVGVVTHVGLNTFADPRKEGSKVNDVTTEDIVELINIGGEERLFYKAMHFDIALIKGSFADERGNISMDLEVVPTEVLSIAQAVHNCGGKVIVQVNKVVKNGSLDPKLVKIPGVCVDYVVEIQEPSLKQQAYGIDYEPELAGNTRIAEKNYNAYIPLNAKKVIARRGAMEIVPGLVGNLGIGIPELVSNIAAEENISDHIVLTVESGPVGGIPQSGPRFGGSINADAIIDQPYQFDFYDGGGLDICYLGLAQADSHGNLNVSKFGTRIAGCGGFISISQNSKKVIFCGTFTTKGLKTEIKDGKLNILEEGQVKKFRKDVEQITFSGDYARSVSQPVLYVTERCVFELKKDGLTLVEIAPGVDLQKDILDQMEFEPIIDKNLKFMDPRIFIDKPMGLK
ncbi:acyl CoA:acetate/3-ketoacid CoA transferase [Peptoniphilus indolicus]|uniref:Propionate CoA-transferase n=2 Tax=Peptoniphilus indolicus TaxID=33030 RepID=G4D1S8_9FIRM|nr:CoA-transferase [Peptoniphilus indolicus]EGY80526.1 propionate CoA-transferase [Peptoniphilus indolicus ATCC 29427]SUB75560.1 Acetate CoA-transferase subunit beta [Peptoniphilus indolicus]